MSSSIPVDRFGSGSLSEPTEKSNCFSRKYVDNLEINHNSETDIILETYGKFIIKNPQSDRADSNIIKFYINDDKINCNSKRLTNLLNSINAQDACTKSYTDDHINATKRILNKSLTCVKYEFN